MDDDEKILMTSATFILSLNPLLLQLLQLRLS
jgi:hypothetical protein